MLPPSNSMTSATPKPAPLLMPKMLGPASGLRKAVCSMSPLTASAPPAKSAVTACGRRDSSTMYCHEGFTSSAPSRMANTSPTGIATEPTTMFSRKSSTMSMPSHSGVIDLIIAFYSNANRAGLVCPDAEFSGNRPTGSPDGRALPHRTATARRYSHRQRGFCKP